MVVQESCWVPDVPEGEGEPPRPPQDKVQEEEARWNLMSSLQRAHHGLPGGGQPSRGDMFAQGIQGAFPFICLIFNVALRLRLLAVLSTIILFRKNRVWKVFRFFMIFAILLLTNVIVGVCRYRKMNRSCLCWYVVVFMCSHVCV